ncbi:MAG: class I SAM-dependent methyltransferase [Devosiaceae bacterium]|nr:class I SAM-dependent methyltransferase [Devosiaceae bacterium MH13]
MAGIQTAQPTPATATAHQTWDTLWQSEDGRSGWIAPEADVLETAADLRLRGAKTALDLGCGVGRHALAFAALGFEASAFDASSSGLEEASRQAAARGLNLTTQQGMMTDLPFDDASFDYVLAFNVIYHGDHAVLAKTISEIARILKPGGTYQGTMLSKRRFDYGVGVEISPNTWVQPEGKGDKVHPHYFCDASELVELFDGFELWSLRDVDHAQRGSQPGSWHWHMVAQKL